MTARSESNLVYGVGIAIRPADMNNLRADAIDHDAAISNGTHGNRTRIWAPTEGTTSNCAFNEANGYLLASGAPWSWTQGLRVMAGERIKSFSIARFGTGAGSMGIALRTVTTAGVRATYQTTSIASPAASWAQLVLTLTTPLLVVSGTEIYLYIDGTTNTQRFNNCELVYDRP